MIKVEISEDKSVNEFKVTLDSNLAAFFKDYYDLFIKFSTLDGETCWESPAIPGNWYTWKGGGCSRYNIELYSKSKGTLYKRNYHSMIDGDQLEKALYLFCSLNPNSKGIVVGSHDGTWGHWVQPVIDQVTEVLIIEGSEKQFSKLTGNYKGYSNCTLINNIVSTDGGDVTWYTYDKGFTDSLVSGVPSKFISEGGSLVQETKSSIEFNKLIEQYNYQDFDWLHTDLEGYDAKLIMSLKYFPKLIIFENSHIKDDYAYILLQEFLTKKGYHLIEIHGDTLAVR